ncbi:hypothetical protein GALL_255100 [mine drainage metagenome]|uniref:Flippase-like domain-containing protein n=1 Tax=mine drainage metagenome TaxID=410659 RepID=A0A1J5R929_9ZZZZ
MIKRWASLALKLALTAAAIWYLSRKVDLGAALGVCRGVHPGWLLAAMLLQGVQMLVCGGRWSLVLRAARLAMPVFQATRLYMIGLFFGQVLPGAVGGDAIRVWKAHQNGLPLSASINSVLLERVLTVFGLLLLATLTLPLLAARVGHSPALWMFPGLTLAGLLGMLLLTVLDRLPARLAHLRLVRGFMALAVDSRRLFFSPARLGTILAVTLFGHVNLTLVVWAMAQGLGAPLSVMDCLALVPPVVLVTILPISISGWGVRENMMVLMLGSVGVGHEQATALSLLFGISGMAISLLGGLFWLQVKNSGPIDFSLKG